MARKQTELGASALTLSRLSVHHADDLQWSSPSDIDFLISLLTSSTDDTPATSRKASKSSSLTSAPTSATHPILLICLYRDNEVSSTHIVSTKLLPALGESALIISLEPLTLANVMAFVAESLRTPVMVDAQGKKQSAREDPSLRMLSEVILSRTQGSPLFVAQVSCDQASSSSTRRRTAR